MASASGLTIASCARKGSASVTGAISSRSVVASGGGVTSGRSDRYRCESGGREGREQGGGQRRIKSPASLRETYHRGPLFPGAAFAARGAHEEPKRVARGAMSPSPTGSACCADTG